MQNSGSASRFVAVLVAFSVGGCTTAEKSPSATWKVSRTNDPITGSSSCVVTAADSISGGSFAFTRVGYIYPIVENNSRFGLLVGVSSGGQVRLPTGDIVWRVDDRPFRELRAVDNPVPEIPAAEAGEDAATQGMRETIATAMRIAVTAGATSTVASGDRAKELLAEMVAGRVLIFRAAQAAPAYGLPTGATYRVGQMTNEGLRPIPLDASFEAGLAECHLAGLRLPQQ